MIYNHIFNEKKYPITPRGKKNLINAINLIQYNNENFNNELCKEIFIIFCKTIKQNDVEFLLSLIKETSIKFNMINIINTVKEQQLIEQKKFQTLINYKIKIEPSHQYYKGHNENTIIHYALRSLININKYPKELNRTKILYFLQIINKYYLINQKKLFYSIEWINYKSSEISELIYNMIQECNLENLFMETTYFDNNQYNDKSIIKNEQLEDNDINNLDFYYSDDNNYQNDELENHSNNDNYQGNELENNNNKTNYHNISNQFQLEIINSKNNKYHSSSTLSNNNISSNDENNFSSQNSSINSFFSLKEERRKNPKKEITNILNENYKTQECNSPCNINNQNNTQKICSHPFQFTDAFEHYRKEFFTR